MHQIKLIFLLKTLNKEEFSRLGKFLNSPFYNYAIPPIHLYKSLKKFYPTFDSPKMTQELIWKKVYTNDAFNANKFWQLTSKLTQLVEQFLISIELEKHPREKQKFLIKALAPRNKKLLVKAIQEVDVELEEKKKTYAIYQEDFLHQLSLSNFHGIFNTTEAIKYEERFLDRLELFYLFQKIKSAINLKSVEKHRNVSYSFYLIPEIIQLVESDDFKQNPLLQFFSKLFQLVNDGSHDLYFEVKEIFIQLMDTFEGEDKKFVFHHLMNYVIFQVNSGDGEFRIEYLNLNKEGLKQNILLENGKISYRTFTNIISQGASLQEFDWTEKFIKEYEKKLPESSKQDALTMGQGLLLFFKNDFSKTIDLLNNNQFEQTLERLRKNELLLRSYFELFLREPSYYNLLISFITSFDKYLHRDEIEANKRIELTINFIKVIKRLSKLIYDKKFLENHRIKFINELKKEKMILKPWLLEKIKSI